MNQNINKEFEDYSWDAMRALLDREMPEGSALIPPVSASSALSDEGKKRRWLWLLGIAIVGIVGSVTGYYYSKKAFTEIQVKPIVETTISNEKNIIKKEGNTEGGASDNTVSPIREMPISIEKNTAKKGQKTEGRAYDNIIASETNNPVLGNTNGGQTIDNQVFKSAKLQINRIDIILENTKKLKDDVRQTSNLPYAFLPLLKAFLMGTPDTNLKINTAQPITQTIKPNKAHKAIWGITTGVHTEGDKTLNGFQAGLVFSKTIRQKWSIQTGLNYRKSTAQGDSLTYVQLDRASSTSSTPVATNFNLAQGKEIKLKNLNYLELPVTLHYVFHRRISAFTGVKAAYLLSNSVSTSDNSKLYVVNHSAADKVSNSTSSNFVQGNSAELLGLKRWDGAIVGGISYSVLPKMVVSLRYDLGLNSILNKQNWKAYNRYLGLSLNYNF